MSAKEINDLKVFEMMAHNNRYFNVTVCDKYFTVETKDTNNEIKIQLKNVSKVSIITPYTISIVTKSYGYFFISLATGYYSVSM